ncbi:MAG: L,D-transpeptidase family protein [Kaistella sp.]|nr:L,D-transpeptidase family protein [Kaistella sp.]
MKTVLNFLFIFSSFILLQGQNRDIMHFLSDSTNLRQQLHYPKSVSRFYSENEYTYAWANPSGNTDQLWTAMLLMNCAPQFGLNFADYHPKYLSSETLQAVMDSLADPRENAQFDIMITDAVITFMNHLHFGKFNPFYPASELDSSAADGFLADEILLSAYMQVDFRAAILETGPKMRAYREYQNYLTRFYTYGEPTLTEQAIKKTVINMERLRWTSTDSPTYLHINIPSFMLAFHQNEQIQHFKIIVGKPASPTPVLKSTVGYFTTAPEWIVPQSIFTREILPNIIRNRRYLADHHYTVYNRKGQAVKIHATALKEIRRNPHKYSIRQSSGPHNSLGAVVFRFSNPYSVYLHDTPTKALFDQSERAFSHGCIRLERAQELAKLLLREDGAVEQIPDLEDAATYYIRKDFALKRPLPIIITYLTFVIQEGTPTFYEDIYHLDAGLEAQFNTETL